MTIQGADLVAVFSGGWLEAIDSPSAPVLPGTPTELDLEFLDFVEEILDEIYADATFWLYGTDSYDPTTGKQTTGDVTPYAKKIIPPYEFDLRYVDGDLIKVGDAWTGVAGKDIEFTLKKGIRVTIGSDIWTIQRIKPICSGNRNPLYLLHLRR